MKAGERLRELRARLGITTREVEKQSRKIATAEANEEFVVSNSWLTQMENRGALPTVHKLFSLSVIYRTEYNDLLRLYGVDPDKLSEYQRSVPFESTQLLKVAPSVSCFVGVDADIRPERTGLLARSVELWEEVPIRILRHLDNRKGAYGYIGLGDYTLYPLLRPGSFVQIDETQREVQRFAWRTDFERPIYFIAHREGYSCGWCEMLGRQLGLVPHPLSPCSMRFFAYPKEVDIVGRVTAVACRVVGWKTPARRTAMVTARG